LEVIEIVTKGIDIRELALTILLEISEEGGFSHIALNQALTKYQYLPKQDRAFLSRLTEGTVERMIELDYMINQFSKIKVKKMKPVIRNILRMGAYQIKYMDQVPVSAACNEAVKLAEKKKFHDLKGFVNGVLRTISRELGNVNYPNKKNQPIQYLSVVYSMPEWIITNWLKELDFDTIEAMLKASFEQTATTIRCNTCKISVEDFKKMLNEQKVTVHPGAYVKEALRIADYDSISRLQGYQEGYFQVQDESSMLVAYAADVREGEVILDVCAAPGGKSLHLAQLLNGTGKVIACDLTESKVELIEENRKRLGFENVEPRVQNALELNEEFIEMADIVIADLPCSGLGIIGKKNDNKYKTTPDKQQELAKLQKDILTVVQQYVKKGGTLIYSTCTINQEENLRNVEWFTNNFDFVLEPLNNYLPLPFQKRERKDSTIKEGYINLIPGIHEADGFFIARLKRKN
jgi:16S rRNA (cytosine967-C5)-methyltransferase